MSGLNPISKCIICFSGVFTDSAVVLIKCGHTFHDQCVKKWLEVGFIYFFTCNFYIVEE